VSIWQAVRATRAEWRALQEQEQALKERDRAEETFKMARDAVDRLFTKVSQNPKLKAQPMEKFRRDLLKTAKEFHERFIEQFDAPGVRHDLGLAYLQLAEIDRELSDYPAAEDSLGKAITTLGELLREQQDMEEYQRDLGASHAALGQIYLKKARFDKADAAFQQALKFQEKLAAAKPKSTEYRYALAKTYSDLGLVNQKGDHPEAAMTWSQKAQDIVTGLMKESPQISEYQSVFITTQITLGQVYLIRGWSEKAETALKEAQSVYGSLVLGQQDVPAEYVESLGQSLALLGMSYRDQYLAHKDHVLLEKAKTLQEEAMKIFQSLAIEHRDVLDYVYDVGRCHLALGQTADRSGRLEDAVDHYDKAIEIMEELKGKDYARALDPLQGARIERALAWAGQGDYARAIKEAEVVQIRQKKLGSVHIYNIACIYSRCSVVVDRDGKLPPQDRVRLKGEFGDEAVRLIRKAIDKGYRHLKVIEKDPDVDPLRTRKDFQELIAELEAKEKESGNRRQDAGDKNQ
jgi:tetratricopeptide (TPR) repeat protein